MEKSFYNVETPEEAMRIYYENDRELYACIKNRTISEVLSRFQDKFKFPASKVLEVGAAGGVWTDYFIKRGAHVTCVDRCEAVLKGNQLLHPDATCIVGDACTVKIDERFDLVFAKDILEHIAEDERFLKNMNAHLKDGGLLLINTQNNLCLNYLIQGTYHALKGNKNWHGWDPTHVRFYNEFSLKKKLTKCGFRAKKWFGSYYVPYRMVHERLGNTLGSKFFNLVELSGLYKVYPLSVLAWNIGVVGEKTESVS